MGRKTLKITLIHQRHAHHQKTSPYQQEAHDLYHSAWYVGGEISHTFDRTSCYSCCDGSLVTSLFAICLDLWDASTSSFTTKASHMDDCFRIIFTQISLQCATPTCTHKHIIHTLTQKQQPAAKPRLPLCLSLSPFPCRPPCFINICQHIFCDTFHMFLSHLSAFAVDQLVAKQTLLHS